MVRTVKNAIAKLIYDRLGEWDRALYSAVHGYRVRETRERESPFELLFGVKPRIPPFDDAAQIVDEDYRPIEIAQIALVRNNLKQEGTTRVDPKFTVGEQVWMARSHDKDRKNLKLALRWDGPYQVAEARPPSYKLRPIDGRITRRYIHKRHLSRYFAGTTQS